MENIIVARWLLRGGLSRVFDRVRFVGRKLFTYQRIIFLGIIVLFSRVYIAGGIKIGLLFGKYAY